MVLAYLYLISCMIKVFGVIFLPIFLKGFYLLHPNICHVLVNFLINFYEFFTYDNVNFVFLNFIYLM